MIGRHHDHPDHICRGTSEPGGCEGAVDREASPGVARRSAAAVASTTQVISTAASGGVTDTRGFGLTARNTTVEV